jgi:hypothetical protein
MTADALDFDTAATAGCFAVHEGKINSIAPSFSFRTQENNALQIDHSLIIRRSKRSSL